MHHDHFLTSHAAYIASLSEVTSYISTIYSDFTDIIKNNNSYHFRIAEFWASISVILTYDATFTSEARHGVTKSVENISLRGTF